MPFFMMTLLPFVMMLQFFMMIFQFFAMGSQLGIMAVHVIGPICWPAVKQITEDHLMTMSAEELLKLTCEHGADFHILFLLTSLC